MRQRLRYLVLLALLTLPASVMAQVMDFGNITATASTCTSTACVSVPVGQAETLTIQVSGTFSATLAFEATSDGTNWVAVQAQKASDGVISTSTTTTGSYSLSNVGYLSVRVRASAYTSGTALVYITRGYGSVRWQGFSSVTVNPGPITVTSNSLGTTSFRAILAENNTAAAAGAQQYSPMVCQEGQGWKTTATAGSQSVEFCWEVQPVQGTSAPSGNYLLKASINGGAFSTVGTFTSGGMFTPAATSGPALTMNTSASMAFNARLTLDAPADGRARFLNWAGNNSYDITLADSGTLLSAEGVSYADAAVLAAPLASGVGDVFVSIGTDNRTCQFEMTGTSAPVEVRDGGTICSITKDNAGTVNFYYDSGYKIQNLRGGTRSIRAVVIGG